MRVNCPGPLPLVPSPLRSPQGAFSQANLHYDPVVHYSILYKRSLPSWFYFTLGFIFVSLGLFWRASIVWLSEGGGGGGGGGREAADFGICYLRLVATLRMGSFSILSEVCRTDLVWKKIITQGPMGLWSI